jgi:hypothetical protein
MKRYLGFFALATLICAVATQTFVFGQDKVERKDKKGGSAIVSGKILEETSAGVRVKVQALGKEELIPSNEVLRVSYADAPAKASLDLGKLAPAEAARDFPALLKGYEGVQALPEMKSAPAGARRYIDYRVASLRAMTADGEDELKAAIKALADFVVAHPNSWEYPHAARQLGRLQADTGDYASATKTFEVLEKTNAPAEFKQDATAMLIDIAFQSEDYKLAADRVEAVSRNPQAGSALRDRVAIYRLGLDGASAQGDLSATIKKLEEAIAKTTDPALKALAYNVMGDVYLAKQQRRDAMWSYLWVDMVYNQDRGEHLKAMTRLIKLFRAENDAEKVKLYEEKLARSR